MEFLEESRGDQQTTGDSERVVGGWSAGPFRRTVGAILGNGPEDLKQLEVGMFLVEDKK